MPKAASGPNSISSLTCELAGDPGSNRLASSFMPALSRSSALSNCGLADSSADISQVSPSQVTPRQGAKPVGRLQAAASMAQANAASQDAASLLGAMGSGRRYFCNTCACHQKNTAVTG